MTNEEIIQAHMVLRDGVDCVVFEPAKATRLVVCFTGMSKGLYNRWSWFYKDYINNGTTMYIIFKDDDWQFYLDRDGESTVKNHCDFIKKCADKHNLPGSAISTTGQSMGGYAAVYYAFLLDCGQAIASVPIVDHHSTVYSNPGQLWTSNIDSLIDRGQWIDLDQFVLLQTKKPSVIVVHGMFTADIIACNKLITALDTIGAQHERILYQPARHVEFLTDETLTELLQRPNQTLSSR